MDFQRKLSFLKTYVLFTTNKISRAKGLTENDLSFGFWKVLFGSEKLLYSLSKFSKSLTYEIASSKDSGFLMYMWFLNKKTSNKGI